VNEPQFSAREIRMLVGLADGSLPAEERQAAERELLDRPDCAAALERQRRAVAAVHAARPSAPPQLRRRIEAQLERPPRGSDIRLPRIGLRHTAVAGVVAAVALALLMVLLPLGPAQAPAVSEVAELAERGIVAPAPAADAQRRGFLAEEADGIPYPDWSDAFGWTADGARADALADRSAETVFYEHEGHHIGYTIIDGDALAPPPDARRIVRNGVELHAYKDGPRDVVTFEREGRTCVLSGDVLQQETLLRLAAWRPGQPGTSGRSHA
jgi:hypothetical protein